MLESFRDRRIAIPLNQVRIIKTRYNFDFRFVQTQFRNVLFLNHSSLIIANIVQDHMVFYVDRITKSLILAVMLMPKFRLHGSRRLSEAVIDSLGTLERQMLIEIRQNGEMSVRQIWENGGETMAYTTIMTTLDRLYKKGLLDRRKVSRAFYYSAKYSAAELEHTVAQDVISVLLETATDRVEPVLACIVDAVSDRDRLYLDELERLVQEKRRELEAKK